VGDCACVTDTNFLWENMDNCIRQWEIFTWISEPQDSTKSLTDTSSDRMQTHASNHPANSNQPPIQYIRDILQIQIHPSYKTNAEVEYMIPSHF